MNNAMRYKDRTMSHGLRPLMKGTRHGWDRPATAGRGPVHILFLMVLCLAASRPVVSQNWSLGVRTGIGTYLMEDLSVLQEMRRKEAALPLETTECYPATLLRRVEADLNWGGVVSRTGFFYANSSTGARSTLSDYSGRYDLDAVINGHQLGMNFDFLLAERHALDFGLYSDAGFIWTTLKTTDLIRLTFPSDYSAKVEYEFQDRGFAGEAGIYLSYTHGMIRGRVSIGYLVNTSGGLHLPGEKDQILYIENDPLEAQWSGLRFGMQFDLLFRKAAAFTKKAAGIFPSKG